MIFYFVLILIIISFWIVGFVYVKKQNLLLAKQNELAIFRAKTNNKIKALEQEKSQLLERLKELEAQLQNQEQNQSST
ncbi:MAG: hypothetical protein Q9M37_04915 [Desulfonauticus sp.]|nr:hypothetical protein [Desulfonauticus sp.]